MPEITQFRTQITTNKQGRKVERKITHKLQKKRRRKKKFPEERRKSEGRTEEGGGAERLQRSYRVLKERHGERGSRNNEYSQRQNL